MCRKYTWPRREMPIATAKEFINKYSGCTFTFSGGDPLSYSNLKELTEYLIHNHIHYQVFTNLAYTLNKDMFEFLDHAKCVQVSLDGPDEDTYRKVRGKDANFAALLFNSCLFPGKIKYNTVISKANFDKIIGLASLAYSMSHPIRFWPVHTHDGMKPTEDMLATIREDIRFMIECGNTIAFNNTNLANWNMLINRSFIPFEGRCFVKQQHRVIDELGNEYPCCRAINDNGCDIGDANNINNLEGLDNPDVLYDFCPGCDRYIQFNMDWHNYKDKEELFL